MSTWQLQHQQRHRGTDLAIGVSRASLLLLTVAFGFLAVTGRTPGLEAQMLVYLVGMVALNLPHGGYEHFENLRRRGLPFGARYVVMYVGFVAGFIALFFVAPILALGIAFATAVAKGGHGDLRVMDAVVGSDHLKHRLQRPLAAFARGGAVMIIPLAFWPGYYYRFSEYMISMFDPGAAGALVAQMEAGRLPLVALYGAAVLAHLGLGLAVDGVSSSWLTDLGETSLLVSFFAAVPVVVSIGLYFPLWYSMRQSGRTLSIDEDGDSQGLPVPVVWGVLIAGALATAAIGALLWFVAPNPLGTTSLLPGLVAFYTIFICVVALPHVVVGEWLDFKRGIWYVP